MILVLLILIVNLVLEIPLIDVVGAVLMLSIRMDQFLENIALDIITTEKNILLSVMVFTLLKPVTSQHKHQRLQEPQAQQVRQVQQEVITNTNVILLILHVLNQAVDLLIIFNHVKINVKINLMFHQISSEYGEDFKSI